MSGNAFTIIATIINFLILMAVLKHFFFDKVSNVIEERNNSVKETLNKADADRKEAEDLKVQNQKNLEMSKEKGKDLVENYRAKAEKLSDSMKMDAIAEADSIKTRAKKDIEREKKKAEADIKGQVVELAVMMSSKALEGSIDENQHRKLINDFISKVGI
jgi:F-type H+-transporting ATPase subunit b